MGAGRWPSKATSELATERPEDQKDMSPGGRRAEGTEAREGQVQEAREDSRHFVSCQEETVEGSDQQGSQDKPRFSGAPPMLCVESKSIADRQAAVAVVLKTGSLAGRERE